LSTILRLTALLLPLFIHLTQCSKPVFMPPPENARPAIERAQSAIQDNIHRREWSAAERALLTLNAKYPEAWNHLQLGIVYSEQKFWSKAEKAFKRAKAMKDGYAEAYYRLGMLYLNGPHNLKKAYHEFYWGLKYSPQMLDTYYQMAHIRIMQRGYEAGLSSLEPLVLRAPLYKDAYKLYTRLGWAFHAQGRMTDFMGKLVTSNPDSLHYISDYVKTLYLNRHYKKALDVLNSSRTQMIEGLPALYYLHQARLNLAVGKDRTAWNAYRLGITHIKTKTEANPYFKDVQYILTEEEWDLYMQGDLATRRQFFHSCWKSRDPTLTTEFNERFVEHYQRLRYALQFNRRWPEKQPLPYFMKEFQVPDMPVTFLMNTLGATRGSRYQQRIDDLGVIYIRHGSPDKFYTKVGLQYHFNLSWKYNARGERPPMVFHFWRSSRPWNRPDLPKMVQNGWVFRETPLYTGDWVAYVEPQEVIESIVVGTTTTTTDIQPSKPITFDWDYFLFRHGQDNAQMIMAYQIPQNLWRKQKPVIDVINQELVVFDGAWRELGRVKQSDTPYSLNQDKERQGLRTLRAYVPPGAYFAGFDMTQMHTSATGNTRFQFENNFHARWLSISSIVLGRQEENLHLYGEEKQESRVDALVPNLRHRFTRDEGILIYFEIYNLLMNMKNKTDASVTLSVSRQEQGRWAISRLQRGKSKPVRVSLEQDIDGGREAEYFIQSLSMPSYAPGKYQLEIRIEDNVAGRVINRSVTFELID